jgi:tetratricopeptide (TPR) repeat protein
MLYELLTGSTPFDPEVVHKAGYDEIRRMIREDEPQQPSARISTLRQAGTIASVAANRKTDPAKLSGLLRGDLDWIVMKALQKDRTRRYQTASDFARDIQHYLNDEPIEARPPTPFDRAAKWARRHRTIVWSAAASVFGGAAAILLGIVFLVSTGKGTVKLEFADAEAARQCTISIDGDDIRIENLGEPIKLRSGKHLLRIVQGDLEIETREFDVVRNGTQVLHVSIAARPGEYATTPSIQERASDYMRRASACADKGDFDKALAEASQAIRLNPWPDVWENCAAVYVAAGRLDEYRSTCAAILERHPQTEDPDTGALTALTCACGPDAVGDWSKVVAMAEMALKRDPKWPRYQRALGNILYRSGRFQEALQHLTEANRLNPEPSELWECSPAELWSFLAMAHYRLGHVEEAKKWLDKAAQWADKAFADERSGAGPRGVPVGRRLLIKCFRAEAEALIKGPAGQKAKTVPEGKEKTEQKPKAESGKRQ